jgi:hypothetical protein
MARSSGGVGHQQRDVLRAQNVARLFDDVIDIRCDLIGRAAGDELFDPARIQVDGEIHRIERRGEPSLPVTDPVRTAGTDQQQSAVADALIAAEVGHIPVHDLLVPVGHDDDALGRPGGAAAVEDPRDRRMGPVAGGDQIANSDVAQFVDDVRKQRKILEGLDIGEWVELQTFRTLQPVPRSRFRAEVPAHGRAQVGFWIIDGLAPGQVKQ